MACNYCYNEDGSILEEGPIWLIGSRYSRFLPHARYKYCSNCHNISNKSSIKNIQKIDALSNIALFFNKYKDFLKFYKAAYKRKINHGGLIDNEYLNPWKCKHAPIKKNRNIICFLNPDRWYINTFVFNQEQDFPQEVISSPMYQEVEKFYFYKGFDINDFRKIIAFAVSKQLSQN